MQLTSCRSVAVLLVACGACFAVSRFKHVGLPKILQEEASTPVDSDTVDDDDDFIDDEDDLFEKRIPERRRKPNRATVLHIK